MNTKEEVFARLDVIVMEKLKSEYGFMYDHLVKESRTKLEQDSRDICQDDMNDQATDGVHSEQIDSHHTDLSASVDFDEISSAMDRHNERLAIISDIYA